MKNIRNLFFSVTLSMAMLPLSACAVMKDKGDDETVKEPLQSELLPFRIVFDAKGTPLIQDKDGKILTLEKIRFPIKEVREIENLHNISVMGVIGSHYTIIVIDGKAYKINLPH